MRSLLDPTFIIPLFDEEHAFHERARKWWVGEMAFGWSTCPLTQNATIRIMSSLTVNGARRFPMDKVAIAVSEFTSLDGHEFWPDSISLFDTTLFDTTKILGPKQITDIYLLGLAVRNKGRFVTFDRRVNRSAVMGCKDENLVLL